MEPNYDSVYMDGFNSAGEQTSGFTNVSDLSTPPEKFDPFKTQIGGNHYSKMNIQPMQYILSNNIPFAEGCVIKYVSRWRDKGGIGDLNKAIHVLQQLIKSENDKYEALYKLRISQ